MARKGTMLGLALGVLVLGFAAQPAEAPHFFRSCTPADGATEDPPVGDEGPVAATVLVLHNTFLDLGTLSPLTFIQAGQAVRWEWASAHCHSAQHGVAGGAGTEFNSGFIYPITEPDSPHVVPGFFDYPVPELEPTLSYTHTFDTPGVYPYFCVHHFYMGMDGVVVVQ